jgi:hypothetical protein
MLNGLMASTDDRHRKPSCAKADANRTAGKFRPERDELEHLLRQIDTALDLLDETGRGEIRDQR